MCSIKLCSLSIKIPTVFLYSCSQALLDLGEEFQHLEALKHLLREQATTISVLPPKIQVSAFKQQRVSVN